MCEGSRLAFSMRVNAYMIAQTPPSPGHDIMSNAQELKTIGLKVTAPRLKILDLFEKSTVRHLSAEDVYKMLIGEGLDIAQLVRGEQDARSRIPSRGKGLEEVATGEGVKACGRLVQDEEFRVREERRRELHPLLFPAGQPSGCRAGRRVDADELKELGRVSVVCVEVGEVVQPLEGARCWVEAPLLEHDADALRDRLRSGLGPEESNRAAGRGA